MKKWIMFLMCVLSYMICNAQDVNMKDVIKQDIIYNSEFYKENREKFEKEFQGKTIYFDVGIVARQMIVVDSTRKDVPFVVQVSEIMEIYLYDPITDKKEKLSGDIVKSYDYYIMNDKGLNFIKTEIK